MDSIIPPIKSEIDYLDRNEREIYCVGNWVQVRVDGKMIPVKIVSIRHDGITVSNNQNIDYTVLHSNKILENLYLLLSSGKEMYSSKPALCVQYAALLMEVDYAIVRLNIDKNILKNMRMNKWPTDYNAWAKKIKEAGKNWGYKDYKANEDACYFYPGFDYKQFCENHEQYWEALHDKLDALVKILEKMGAYVKRGLQIEQAETKAIENHVEDKEASVYISYSWSMMDVADDICKALENNGVIYRRDVKDCGYRQNIKQFEREIGKGARVLAIINDSYLRSVNCMYELALVFQHGDIEHRLYPVVNMTGKRDAQFFKELYDYWNAEYLSKRQVLNELSSGTSLQAIDELGYCDVIVRELPKITSYLSNVNTLTYEQLAENGFRRVVDEMRTMV